MFPPVPASDTRFFANRKAENELPPPDRRRPPPDSIFRPATTPGEALAGKKGGEGLRRPIKMAHWGDKNIKGVILQKATFTHVDREFEKERRSFTVIMLLAPLAAGLLVHFQILTPRQAMCLLGAIVWWGIVNYKPPKRASVMRHVTGRDE